MKRRGDKAFERFQADMLKFIGTHRQYDAVDADTVEME